MTKRLVLFAVSLVAVVGCSLETSVVLPGPPDTGAEVDSSGPDSAPRPDSATTGDSSTMPPDSAAGPDSSTVVDSSVATDSALPVDSGMMTEVLFESRSPHNASDFNTSSGFTVTSDHLASACGTERAFAVFRGAETWTDYETSAEITFQSTTCSGNFVALFARGSASTPDCSIRGYYCTLGLNDTLYLGRTDGGCGIPREIQRSAGTIVVDATYTLRLRLQGTTVSCTVSGGAASGVLESTDATVYTSGTSGLVAEDANAHFDNLLVTRL